jgi:phytoene synthase
MSARADDFAYCEALVRSGDKDRFLASLFVPAERRRFLHALYAFDLEVARVGAAAREPMAGAIRLQWWREALTGERPGEAAASPVAAALIGALTDTSADRAPLLDLIEARRAALFGEPAAPVAPDIYLTAARLLGGDGATVADAAHDAGLADDQSRDPVLHPAARVHYAQFRAALDGLPRAAAPAFLPAALIPLRLANPDPPQWRRQVALARAAWIGFPAL